jgi:hypothetical protein
VQAFQDFERRTRIRKVFVSGGGNSNVVKVERLFWRGRSRALSKLLELRQLLGSSAGEIISQHMIALVLKEERFLLASSPKRNPSNGRQGYRYVSSFYGMLEF